MCVFVFGNKSCTYFKSQDEQRMFCHQFCPLLAFDIAGHRQMRIQKRSRARRRRPCQEQKGTLFTFIIPDGRGKKLLLKLPINLCIYMNKLRPLMCLGLKIEGTDSDSEPINNPKRFQVTFSTSFGQNTCRLIFAENLVPTYLPTQRFRTPYSPQSQTT